MNARRLLGIELVQQVKFRWVHNKGRQQESLCLFEYLKNVLGLQLLLLVFDALELSQTLVNAPPHLLQVPRQYLGVLHHIIVSIH